MNYIKIIFIAILLLFLGCEEKPKELVYPIVTDGFDMGESDVLTYLNQQRLNSGMVAFDENSILQKSAKNHAIYDAKNKNQGHDEISSKRYFTGVSPAKRALHVGYENKIVSENISYNKDIISSVDSLFTAIYHRFGFLSFDKNEIGFSWQKDGDYSSAVFVMGNSYINDICKNGGDKNPRRYYNGICKNENTKIEETKFKRATKFANDDVIVYPYKNAEDASIYFSGEIPDPMPSCKITANPISVNFAPFTSEVELKSFKIYENDKQIQNTKIITHQNDINSKFTKKEFALFPIKTFTFNTHYKAVFTYIQDRKEKVLSWNFKTKSPTNDYFYVKNNEYLAIKPDIWYDIFFTPDDCNDILKKYNIKRPSYTKFEIIQKGVNHLSIKASGLKDDEISLRANAKEINFVLQNTSIGMEENNLKYFFYGGLLLILAIIVGVWKRF